MGKILSTDEIKGLLKDVRVPAGAEVIDFRFIIPLWRTNEHGECMYLYDADWLCGRDMASGIDNSALFVREANVYNLLLYKTFNREAIAELMKGFIERGFSFRFPKDVTPEMKAIVFRMAETRGRYSVQGFIDRYFSAERISSGSEDLRLCIGMPG